MCGVIFAAKTYFRRTETVLSKQANQGIGYFWETQTHSADLARGE